MKRRISAILLGIMLVLSVVISAACSPKHTHSYGNWQTATAATCTTAGEKYRSCIGCDEVEREAIPATGHTQIAIPAVGATCTAPGHTAGKKCAVCDTIITATSVVQAHGHTEKVIPALSASCGAAGHTEGVVCEVCNYNITPTQVIAKTPHNYENVQGAQASYAFVDEVTHKMVTPRICDGCGEEYDLEVVSNHVYKVTITAQATCQQDGEYTYTCVSCGHAYTEDWTASNAHNWVDDGMGNQTCDYGCGAVRTLKTLAKNETIAKEEITSDTVLKIENDVEVSLDQETLSALEGEISLGAEQVGKDSLPADLDQNKKDAIGDSPVFDFTLTAGGTNVPTFGGKITITIPYVLGVDEDPNNISIWHVADNGEVLQYPATYSNGFVTFEAEHFSYYAVVRLTREQYCSIFGHNNVDIGYAATCERDGYQGQICAHCGYLPETNQVIKTTGHDYREQGVVAPTCEEIGYTLFACVNANCGMQYQSTAVDALGHDMVEGETFPATCQNRGYTEYACSRCDVSENKDFTDKVGHNYTNGTCTYCQAEQTVTSYPYINLVNSIFENGFTINVEKVTFDLAMSMDEVETFFGEYENTSSTIAKVTGVVNQYKIALGVVGGVLNGQVIVDAKANVSADEEKHSIVIKAVAQIVNANIALSYDLTLDGENQKGYIQLDCEKSLDQALPEQVAGIMSMATMIFESIDVDTLTAIQALLTDGGSIVSDAISGFITDNFFTASSVVDGKKTYTLNVAKIRELVENLKTKTISEVYDVYFGTGAFDKLLEDITAMGNVTVGDMLTWIETKGITEEKIIELANQIVPMITGGEFDLAQMLTPEMKQMTVDQMCGIIMQMLPSIGGPSEDMPGVSGPNFDANIPGRDEVVDGNYGENVIVPMETESSAPTFTIGDLVGQYAPMIESINLFDLLQINEYEGYIQQVLNFLEAMQFDFTLSVDANGNEYVDLKQIVNDAIGQEIEKYYTVGNSASGITYTFKNEVIVDFVTDLQEMKVGEFVDKYFGEDNYEKLSNVLSTMGINLGEITSAIEEMTIFEAAEALGAPSNMLSTIDAEIAYISAIVNSNYSLVIRASDDYEINSVKLTLPTDEIKIDATVSNSYGSDFHSSSVQTTTTIKGGITLGGTLEYVTAPEFNKSLFANSVAGTFFQTNGVYKFDTDQNDSYVEITVEDGLVKNIDVYVLVDVERTVDLVDEVEQVTTVYTYYEVKDAFGLVLGATADSNVFDFCILSTNSMVKGYVITVVDDGEPIVQEGVEEIESSLISDFNGGRINLATEDLLFATLECNHNYLAVVINKQVTCVQGTPGRYVSRYCYDCGLILEKNKFEEFDYLSENILREYHVPQIVAHGFMHEGSTDCEQGNYILYSCVNCPNTYYLDTSYSHNVNATNTVYDFSEYSDCGLKVTKYTCLCGKESVAKVDGACDFGYSYSKTITMADGTEMYVREYHRCTVTNPQCNLAYAYTYTYDVVGCEKFQVETLYVFTVDGDVHTAVGVYEINRDYYSLAHDFVVTSDDVITNVENGTKTTYIEKCSKCNLENAEIVISTSVTDENGVTTIVKSEEAISAKDGVELYRTFEETITSNKNDLLVYMQTTSIESDEKMEETVIYTWELTYVDDNVQYMTLTRQEDEVYDDWSSNYYAQGKITPELLEGNSIEYFQIYFDLNALQTFWNWSEISAGPFEPHAAITEYVVEHNKYGEDFYREWKVTFLPGECLMVVEERYDKTDEFTSTSHEMHFTTRDEVVVTGNCALPNIIETHCNVCGILMNSHTEEGRHNYEYADGRYVCIDCGLENFTGYDGRTVICYNGLDGDMMQFDYFVEEGGREYYWIFDNHFYHCYADDPYQFAVVLVPKTGDINGIINIEGIAIVDTPYHQYEELSLACGNLSISQTSLQSFLDEYAQNGVDVSQYEVAIAVNVYSSQTGFWYSYQYVIA